MDSQIINNVILYLNQKPTFSETRWLQREGNNGTYVTEFSVIISELNRLKLIDTDFKNGQERILLNSKSS